MKAKKLILPLLGLTLMTPAMAYAETMPTGQPATMSTEDETSAPLELYTVKMRVNDTKLDLNGYQKTMAASPMLMQNKLYVPLRTLSENVGADVMWDDANGTTTVVFDGYTMVFTLGQDTMEINGVKVAMGAMVMQNADGYAMAPLRFLADQLGWTVDYSTLDWSFTLTKMLYKS